MKRILILSTLLVVISASLYVIKHDIGFSTIILLAGFLAILCYSVFTSLKQVLSLEKVEENLNQNGKYKIETVLNGYQLKVVSDLGNFRVVKRYFDSEVRSHDSEDYLQDMSKSLFFAALTYLFGTLFYIVSFMATPEPQIDITDTNVHEMPIVIKQVTSYTSTKIHYAYIYFLAIAGYTFWYISPILLFRKKNTLLCHNLKHTKASAKHIGR